jgi:NADPH:quinone reductase-like Zn-dependent oxidoreductase
MKTLWCVAVGEVAGVIVDVDDRKVGDEVTVCDAKPGCLQGTNLMFPP